jgi:hypothetical protein
MVIIHGQQQQCNACCAAEQAVASGIGSPVFWNFEDLHCKLHRKANTTDFPRSVPCHHAAREAA